MNTGIRLEKIIIPAIVGTMIRIIYTIFSFLLTISLAHLLGPGYFLYFIPLIEIMEISILLFIGMITYFICFKKKGTVIERFVSGIIFPFIFGFVIIIISSLFPNYFYVIEITQDPELFSRIFLEMVSDWLVNLVTIFCGSVLMHFIIKKIPMKWYTVF